MWKKLVETPNLIEFIYQNEMPNFDLVELLEFSFINGTDIICRLKFDINSLPQYYPKKWLKSSQANTTQFIVELVGVSIISVTTNGSDMIGKLQLSEVTSELKNVKFISVLNNCVFNLDVKWFYIKSINNYYKE